MNFSHDEILQRVQVKQTKEFGNGLYAKQKFQPNDLIFAEYPQVTCSFIHPDELQFNRTQTQTSSQNENVIPLGRSKIKTCSFCLKSLETPSENLARYLPLKIIFRENPHLKEMPSAFPFEDICYPSAPKNKKECTDCLEPYCSENCKALAWQSFHQFLCPKLLAESAKDALRNLIFFSR